METLLHKLKSEFPSLRFTSGERFCWSPKTHEIIYQEAEGPQAEWSLLHEAAHALLDHTSYHADYELIRLEVEAWEKARYIGTKLNITISEDHIQDCLDTYRDWLYRRSICPACGTKCLQQSNYLHYSCFNCHTVWHVSPSRFCRSYRSTKNVVQSHVIFDLT